MKLTLFRFNCRLTVGAVSLCSSGLAQLCNQEVCSTSHDVHFRRGPRESGSRSVGTWILCLQSPNRSQALSNITSQFIEARFWERLSKQNPPFAWKFFTNHTHDQQWTPKDTVRFAARMHLSKSSHGTLFISFPELHLDTVLAAVPCCCQEMSWYTMKIIRVRVLAMKNVR